MGPPVIGSPEEAVIRLRAGGLVALPTETVYGLGARASDRVAVGRIFAVKGRPANHPVIVHIADVDELGRWAESVPDTAKRLADAFWPGPLTLLLRKRPAVLDVVTGGRRTVGLRVPDHQLTRRVLTDLDDGVAAPSANRFGRVSPTTAQHVLDDLGGVLDPATDAILDGGPCAVGLESTIIDLSGDRPLLLRQGGVPAEAVSAVLGGTVEMDKGPARAPGMLISHYAPHAEVVAVVEGELMHRCCELLAVGARVGVVAPQHATTPLACVRFAVPEPYGGPSLAPLLYARFRDADDGGCTHLVVQLPAAGGVGNAVIDRVLRAASAAAAGPQRLP